MKLTTDALIIRENNAVGESDRFVTALTRQSGVVQASVRGARNIKNRNSAATQLLCYSRLSLYKGREKYIVDDSEPLQVFFEVRNQLDKLALAQYFCELAGILAPREEEAEPELRLLLNALHYLAEGTRPLWLIKAVVELRLLTMAGYMPDVTDCARCDAPFGETAYLLPQGGGVLCAACGETRGDAIPVSGGVLAAMRHIVSCEFGKLFSFSLPDEAYPALAYACEQYLLCQLQRGFRTLDFFHSLNV